MNELERIAAALERLCALLETGREPLQTSAEHDALLEALREAVGPRTFTAGQLLASLHGDTGRTWSALRAVLPSCALIGEGAGRSLGQLLTDALGVPSSSGLRLEAIGTLRGSKIYRLVRV